VRFRRVLPSIPLFASPTLFASLKRAGTKFLSLAFAYIKLQDFVRSPRIPTLYQPCFPHTPNLRRSIHNHFPPLHHLLFPIRRYTCNSHFQKLSGRRIDSQRRYTQPLKSGHVYWEHRRAGILNRYMSSFWRYLLQSSEGILVLSYILLCRKHTPCLPILILRLRASHILLQRLGRLDASVSAHDESSLSGKAGIVTKRYLQGHGCLEVCLGSQFCLGSSCAYIKYTSPMLCTVDGMALYQTTMKRSSNTTRFFQDLHVSTASPL
jgi:hypothetical protein